MDGIFHIYINIYYYYYLRTSDCSNFALQRTARRLTAHVHRCVKLKQGKPLHARPGQISNNLSNVLKLLNKAYKRRVRDKARHAPSLVHFLYFSVCSMALR